MIPQIKIPKDGITADKHVMMLFHAYLPSTCMCLASVCRQLFLPGSDLQTNNEGQTDFSVSTPKASHIKFLPLSTELQILGFGAQADTQCGAFCLCTVCFPHLTWRKRTRSTSGWEDLKKDYLLLVATLPGFASHAITGVPMSRPLAGTAVFMSEEAAGWGLTGCCGTERRLRHPRNRLKIK